MAKSFKTIYFSSELMLEAEKKEIDINAICNEALRIAVNREANQGTPAGELGNFLDKQAFHEKNKQIMRKLAKNKDERFNRNLHLYATEYGLSIAEALKEIEG